MEGSANLLYILKDAVSSAKENLATTVLTAFTLGFSLAIFSLFLFVSMNLNTAIRSIGDRTHMIVYVKDEVTPDIDRYRESVKRMQGIKSVEYISKEKALQELKTELGGHSAILEGVEANPLPASFEVKVLDTYRDASKVKSIADGLKKMSWVEEVQYSQEWVEKFASLVRFAELIAFVIGFFMAAATVFIISNTVRLAVYARKEEIEIMRLVGASDAYVKMPFLIEGVIQGIIGGLLAFAVLEGGRLIILSKVPQYFSFALSMPFSPALVIPGLALAGAVMGVAGSLITMSRFLKV